MVAGSASRRTSKTSRAHRRSRSACAVVGDCRGPAPTPRGRRRHHARRPPGHRNGTHRPRRSHRARDRRPRFDSPGRHGETHRPTGRTLAVPQTARLPGHCPVPATPRRRRPIGGRANRRHPVPPHGPEGLDTEPARRRVFNRRGLHPREAGRRNRRLRASPRCPDVSEGPDQTQRPDRRRLDRPQLHLGRCRRTWLSRGHCGAQRSEPFARRIPLRFVPVPGPNATGMPGFARTTPRRGPRCS